VNQGYVNNAWMATTLILNHNAGRVPLRAHYHVPLTLSSFVPRIIGLIIMVLDVLNVMIIVRSVHPPPVVLNVLMVIIYPCSAVSHAPHHVLLVLL
jgi:hypothetical protein